LKQKVFYHSAEIFGRPKSIIVDADKFHIMDKALLNFAKHPKYRPFYMFLTLFPEVVALDIYA
jgi:hypothetical protein